MDITYRKASHKDIDTLIKLRLDYLTGGQRCTWQRRNRGFSQATGALFSAASK